MLSGRCARLYDTREFVSNRAPQQPRPSGPRGRQDDLGWSGDRNPL